MSCHPDREQGPSIEEIETSITYMIARINAEQPRPDQRLFTELGRLTYLMVRMEES